MKIVFLCSGGGGNLKFLHLALQAGVIKGAVIDHVFCDRICRAHEFANKINVGTTIEDFSPGNQLKIAHWINSLGADLIVCNMKKILSETFITECGCNTINLHYSLLPAFPGMVDMKPVKEALRHGSKIAGVTLHAITPVLDMGPPLTQVAIPVRDSYQQDSLENFVFECGALCLLSYVNSLLNGLQGKPVVFSLRQQGLPALMNPSTFPAEDYESAQFGMVLDAVRSV